MASGTTRFDGERRVRGGRRPSLAGSFSGELASFGGSAGPTWCTSDRGDHGRDRPRRPQVPDPHHDHAWASGPDPCESHQTRSGSTIVHRWVDNMPKVAIRSYSRQHDFCGGGTPVGDGCRCGRGACTGWVLGRGCGQAQRGAVDYHRPAGADCGAFAHSDGDRAGDGRRAGATG